MDVQLVMFRDGGEHRPFTLSKSTTVIGRREDCDLRIAVGDVSRKHCRVISKNGDGVMRVEDLGSSNGTYVNGTRVQNAELKAGDTLQVGPVMFVVQVDGEPAVADFEPAARVSIAPPAAHVLPEGSRDAPTVAVPSKKSKPKSIDDEIGDIDELEILNDSGGGSRVDIDLDGAEK